MSDGWFDRAYRSGETPPAELDARVLAAARRATRRWTLPAVAAGALTIVAAAVLGFLITSHELYVRTDEAPVVVDSPPEGDGFRIDVVQPSGNPERLRPLTEIASPEMLREPGGIPPADSRAEAEGSKEPLRTSAELDCRRSALVGPLGGPERGDLVQICSGDGVLYIDVVWDGEPACPSRLELEAPSGVPVRLDGPDLVVAKARYRCQNGQWVASDRERSGGPTTRPGQ
ncbi:MAG: hypothetical protein OXK82_04035 [Deltaproteobacteria bacterium]|nr:hypothetical protein [Deltaproteobacteria bacterium]